MSDKKVEVDFMAFHILKNAVDAMQGHTFYCEDGEGLLRRWTPPRPYTEVSEESS